MSGIRVVLTNNRTDSLEVAPSPRHGVRQWRSVHEDTPNGDRPTVYVTQEAFYHVNAHGRSDLEREVGGVLVGEARQTPQGRPYVIVEAQLPARQVEHGPTHLTFTPETQIDFVNRLEDTYPGKQIVGWYHTHPGLGIFLSSMDVWLHSHFFPRPWQVALVIDPREHTGGFFSYTVGEGQTLNSRHYAGFYTLNWDDPDGAVLWRNLVPAGAPGGSPTQDPEEENYLTMDEEGLS